MSLLKTRYIKLACFITFVLMIILPPIINGYIYPSAGDDSALHLEIIKNGDLWHQLYYSYVLIGFPIKCISEITSTSINVIFLWFNYLSLIISGLTFYFVISKLVNYKAGLLSLFIPFAISLGLKTQFDYGMIFNIINIGIVLPLLVYSGIKWFTNNKLLYLVLFLIFDFVYSIIHSTGIYLAPILVIMLLIYMYLSSKKHNLNYKVMVVLISILAINIFCSYILIKNVDELLPKAIEYSFSGRLMDLGYYLGVISIMTCVIFAYSIRKVRQNYTLNIQNKLFLLILAVACLVIFISTLGFSPTPDRQIFDLSTIIALIAVTYGGLVMTDKLNTFMIIGMIVIGIGFNIFGLFGYRSAVKPADIQAINYMNTLEYMTYNCSIEISPLIYDQFVKQEFVESNSDIFIERDKPMTPCSDKESNAFIEHEVEEICSYKLINTFKDKYVEINIYKRISN